MKTASAAIAFYLKIDFVRRIPAFFRLIPYTPVPLTAIDASEFRRRRPTIYEQLACLNDRILDRIFTTTRRGMSSFTRHTRLGAKARKTNYQPVGRMSPIDIHQEPRHKPSRDQGSPNKIGGATQAALASPNRTWADAVRVTGANTVAIRQPTFHTMAKDVGFPYPFAANPHLLIIGRY